jgi:hypothetical protein
MEFAIEESICSLLREIFGTVSVDNVTLRPSPEGLGDDPALSCCMYDAYAFVKS